MVAAVLVCLTLASSAEQPTGTWKESGALSEVRSDATATELADGRVLIAGGANHEIILASAEIVTADGDVTVIANMATPRAGHTATRLGDGRVLVTGGITAGGDATATAEVFDPTSGTWTTVGMDRARMRHTATLVSSGQVVVAGGEAAGAPLASIEVFDPRDDAFRAFPAALASPRSAPAAAALPDGHVMVLGGWNASGVLASTEIIDVALGSVTPGPMLISARAEATATDLLDGSVLVTGGTDGGRELASAERYSVVAGRFVSVGAMADVDFADLLDYFGDDANTKSIILYMESIGDVRNPAAPKLLGDCRITWRCLEGLQW
jgi:hypothetical protein